MSDITKIVYIGGPSIYVNFCAYNSILQIANRVSQLSS